MIMHNIKSKFLLMRLCILALSIIALPAQAQRTSLDKIIAIVDDGVILQSELEARLSDIIQNARATNQQLPPEAEIRSQVLDLLVIENLQMQMANRMSIRFDDDTLNRVMAQMAESSNMSFDAYVSALDSAGVYRRTREQVRKELTLRELQRGVVNRRISITDQEIENFLNSEMGRSTMAADFLVDHMLVSVSESDADTVVQTKLAYASELVAAIEDGRSFTEVRASAQQQGIFEVSGRLFDWMPAAQLPSLFVEIVPTMAIQDVAGPIRAGNGFHIIMLADKRGGTDQMIRQTNVRHIMVTPNEIRTEEQTLALITRLRDQIANGGASFADLARQNSDDASSVVSGGNLNWINEGGMPRAMAQVVDELEVGELSEPFRTDSGWHIAEVVDRRVTDMSRQYSMNQAEETLRNRKFDLELENWLLELRESAFVQIKE